MKKRTIRIIVLSVVFIIALFVTSHFTNNGDASLAVEMERATLPTISFTVNGQEMNLLAGHVSEMNLSAVWNTVVPLDEEGKVVVNIQKYEQDISTLRYEILNTDGTVKLAEKTEENVGETYTIQAGEYLEAGKEAVLKICLGLSNNKNVYFYTRVTGSSGIYFAECVDYVKTLHTNIIEKADTSSIEKVLETNSQGDNTTLQHVTIHSDLKHVTWGGMHPEVIRGVYWSVEETKASHTSIRLDYQVKCADSNNEEEIYNVKEFFRVRYLDGKYYLLTYDRTLEEKFDAAKQVLSSKGINLGFATQDLQCMANEDGSVVSFVQANDLWNYNRKANEFTLIFSFADSKEDDVRHRNNSHSLKILAMEETGNITFAVYGYMNRGDHEGESGAAIYYYDLARNVIEEKAFIPSNQSYAFIEKELGKVAYYNNKQDVFYVMTAGELCKLDLKTDEKTVLLSNLQNGQYVSSDDGRLVSYQKEDNKAEAIVIDFATGSEQTISADEGEVVQPLGFVMGDFVYGIGREQDAGHLTSGERALGMYKLEIRDAKGKVVKTYQVSGSYILGVKISGNMLTLNRAALQNGEYKEIPEDYITNNEEKANTISLQSYQSDSKEAQLRLAFEKGIDSKKAKVLEAKQVLFERNTTITFEQTTETPIYSVFGLGKLIGVYTDAGEAIEAAENAAGIVISPKQNCIWEDGNRASWYRNFEIGAFRANGGESALAACIRAVLSYEGETVDVAAELGNKTALEVLSTHCGGEAVQFKGCHVSAMRYLIDKGIPVIALTGSDSAIVLVGYDAQTITYIDPSDGNARTRNFSAVDAMISGSGSVFLGYVR